MTKECSPSLPKGSPNRAQNALNATEMALWNPHRQQKSGKKFYFCVRYMFLAPSASKCPPGTPRQDNSWQKGPQDLPRHPLDLDINSPGLRPMACQIADIIVLFIGSRFSSSWSLDFDSRRLGPWISSRLGPWISILVVLVLGFRFPM